MKKIIIILSVLIVFLGGLLIYFIKNITPDIQYYNSLYKEIQKEENSDEVMKILKKQYILNEQKSKYLKDFYKRVFQDLGLKKQNVDIQVLLYYFALSQKFGDIDFEKIKQSLIENNLIYTLQTNVVVEEIDIREKIFLSHKEVEERLMEFQN